jgi:hypothetical protein
MSEWISVDDKLPKVGEYVVVYRPLAKLTNDPVFDVSLYDGIERTSPQGVKHRFDMWCHPTHWMPIPEAPKCS